MYPTIGREFARLLTEYMGEEKMSEVVSRNKSWIGTEFEGCCASHDFCDANVFMLEAFKEVKHD